MRTPALAVWRSLCLGSGALVFLIALGVAILDGLRTGIGVAALLVAMVALPIGTVALVCIMRSSENPLSAQNPARFWMHLFVVSLVALYVASFLLWREPAGRWTSVGDHTWIRKVHWDIVDGRPELIVIAWVDVGDFSHDLGCMFFTPLLLIERNCGRLLLRCTGYGYDGGNAGGAAVTSRVPRRHSRLVGAAGAPPRPRRASRRRTARFAPAPGACTASPAPTWSRTALAPTHPASHNPS
ncbi:MAG: hypothetical protein ACYS9X_26350 [Planctomycetota bacterium]|jgi:hypothetical protein